MALSVASDVEGCWVMHVQDQGVTPKFAQVARLRYESDEARAVTYDSWLHHYNHHRSIPGSVVLPC